VTTQEIEAPELAAPTPRARRRFGELWAGWMQVIRPAWLSDDVVRGIRWGLVGTWVFAFGRQLQVNGIPYVRSDLLVWIVALLFACSVGQRALFTVVIDFLPFAAVLVAYDYLRGISDTFGMPTWWHPQVDVDRFLFAGHQPTVWLQEHLKHADAHWYDVVVALCYFSFFFLPYVMAGVMWLRSRKDFYRWSLRFVALSFLAFVFFALTPSAPPWAAARCTAAQVANHPNNPGCMYLAGRDVPSGGLLGPFTMRQPGAMPWLERISTRGFEDLHLHFASIVIKAGQGGVDAVAAVPSLHFGGTLLFVIFMWRRVNRWWRPVLVVYPLLMAFSLVYSGEHYVSDCIAGGIGAVLIHVVANCIERWRYRRSAPDTLEVPPESMQETPCPPSRPLPETTPSST
jgi:hypothetical protein